MIITLIVVAILIFTAIGIYNSLVTKRNNTENAFGAVDAMLKKRYDLIPNMVATVKKYAEHEYATFAKVSDMRSKAYESMSPDEKGELDRQFTAAGRQFFAIAENYPQLRASENFVHLQRTLNETEEQISAARRTYNAAVTEYNNAVETFPGNIFAGMYKFKRKPVLEIPQAERENVDVKGLFDQD